MYTTNQSRYRVQQSSACCPLSGIPVAKDECAYIHKDCFTCGWNPQVNQMRRRKIDRMFRNSAVQNQDAPGSCPEQPDTMTSDADRLDTSRKPKLTYRQFCDIIDQPYTYAAEQVRTRLFQHWCKKNGFDPKKDAAMAAWLNAYVFPEAVSEAEDKLAAYLGAADSGDPVLDVSIEQLELPQQLSNIVGRWVTSRRQTAAGEAVMLTVRDAVELLKQQKEQPGKVRWLGPVLTEKLSVRLREYLRSAQQEGDEDHEPATGNDERARVGEAPELAL